MCVRAFLIQGPRVYVCICACVYVCVRVRVCVRVTIYAFSVCLHEKACVRV